MTPDRPAGDDRHARRRPARPLHRRRRPPDGLRHGRARPRPRRAGRRASPTCTSWRRTTIRPPSTTWPRSAPSSRPSSRTRRPRRWSGSPPTSSSPRRRPLSRSPRTAWPRSRFLRERGVPTAPSVDRATPRRLPGDRQDGPPGLRRQGPGRRRRRRRARRRARPSSRVPCVVERRVPLDAELSVLVARTADGAPRDVPGRREPPRRRHPRPHRRPGPRRPRRWPPRPGAGAGHRRATSTTSACSPSSCSSATAGCSSTSWRRGPHNSGHWTLDAAATSQFDQQVRAVCGPGPRPDRAVGGAAVAMVNLLGDLWVDGEPAWDAALADPAARLHLYGKAGAPGPAARWATSPCSATTPPAARSSPCATRLTR